MSKFVPREKFITKPITKMWAGWVAASWNVIVLMLQVMVTAGPGGEETSVYDITMSEIQSGM